MKKVISIFLILFTLNMRVNAAVAGVWAFFNPAVAGTIALYGLAAPGAGYVTAWVISKAKGCDEAVCDVGFVFGTILGLLILDEDDNSTYEFSKLSNSDALKLGIKVNQMEIFNSELEETNILLKEVASKINKDSTFSEVNQHWTNLRDLVSPETMEVMMSISTQLNK